MSRGIRDVVASKVATALQQTIFIEDGIISDATSLSNDLGLGRLARLKLALYLEDMFDLELSNEDVDSFQLVGDIVRYMSRRYFRDQDVNVVSHAAA